MKWLYCDFIAGSIGGAAGVFIGHPLDTIKTWQQTSNTRVGSAIFQIVKRNNGINGFYRGMLFPFITTGAINSVLFGIYGNHLRQLQKVCHSDFQREQFFSIHIFAAGSLAGFLQSFIACPIELIKVRLQTHRYYHDYLHAKPKTPLACMKTIVRSNGISGLYRGLLPMMCRDVFPYGIYMLAYQRTMTFFDNLEFVQKKRQVNKHKSGFLDSEFEIVITTLAGAFAGVLSWILVIPFDVIKTIMQAEENSKYRDMRDCIKFNLKKKGWRSLFRGSWMLVVRAIPVNAATFLGYEYALEMCQKMSDVYNL